MNGFEETFTKSPIKNMKRNNENHDEIMKIMKKRNAENQWQIAACDKKTTSEIATFLFKHRFLTVL